MEPTTKTCGSPGGLILTHTHVSLLGQRNATRWPRFLASPGLRPGAPPAEDLTPGPGRVKISSGQRGPGGNARTALAFEAKTGPLRVKKWWYHSGQFPQCTPDCNPPPFCNKLSCLFEYMWVVLCVRAMATRGYVWASVGMCVRPAGRVGGWVCA